MSDSNAVDSSGAAGNAGTTGNASGAGAQAGTNAAATADNTGAQAGKNATATAGKTSGAGGQAGTSAPNPACSGKPGMLRGKITQTLTAGGLDRSFIYYAPSSLAAGTPAPVVLIAHGYTMSAEQMFQITRYSDLADQEHFVVIFLDGEPDEVGPWNVGMPDCVSSLGILPLAMGDDQAYVDAVLNFAEADQCLDRKHVFMTGFSMGGYFSNENGCLRDDIRAIAPHSGGTHELDDCKTQHKPALIMHFDGDALIPYDCGSQARDRWVARNGCSTDAPDVKTVNGGSCEYYKGCPADGQVAFCTFKIPDMEMDGDFPGHAWSGGMKVGEGAAFAIPETESATRLGWDFFKTYAW